MVTTMTFVLLLMKTAIMLVARTAHARMMAVTISCIRAVAERHGLKVQDFVIRQDGACGRYDAETFTMMRRRSLAHRRAQ
jgi:hypothetical protein